MPILTPRSGLVLVLVLAVLPRVAWYRRHQPVLPPDAYSYLNVAREWRGEPAPDYEWDDRAQLPAGNDAARTPGYPLFLDLVFALSGHSPTNEAALERPRKVLANHEGSAARANHLRRLQTDENVRAVQAVQHALAVMAPGFAFFILVQWTGSVPVSIAGSLAAVGWNPVWIVTFEPSVMTETLAGVLILISVWLAGVRSKPALCGGLAAALGAAGVAVRPAAVFAAAPVTAYLLWRERHHLDAALAIAIPPVLIVAALVANNGVRYGYWGITSITGLTFLSHAHSHPGALRDPLRSEAAQRPYTPAMALHYRVASESHRRFLDVKRDVDAAALGYVIDHHRWYLISVGEAFLEFCSPPLRHVPGDLNVFRQRFPRLWQVVSALGMLLLAAGIFALFVRVPAVVKLGPAVFLLSGIGTSLLAHTENRRFAAPVMPLVLMSGAAVLHRMIQDRRHQRSVQERRSTVGEATARSAKP